MGVPLVLITSGKNNGTGKRLKLRDLPTQQEKVVRDAPYTLSIEGLPSLVKKMMDDPAFAAEIAHRLRKPTGVDARRHGIAGRSAIREPMLNARADSIAAGLAYNEPTKKKRMPKGHIYDRIVVKPRCLETARLEYHSAFWGERMWIVFTMRYGKGYVVVTDKGSESKVFMSYGELKSAINKSGWEIVR
jgi:hypothetical protein